MADFQKSDVTVPHCTTPREQVAVLQEVTAGSLLRDGANTSVPCPVADEIFEQLFGRLWLQATIIRSHKSAEELLSILKLDYDATLEFYRQRRESTNRETVNFEDDEELQQLLAEERAAEGRLAGLRAALAGLEERERREMARWLGRYGIAQLVFQGRVAGLAAQDENLKLRTSLLDQDRDLLACTDELLAWVGDLEAGVSDEEAAPAAEEPQGEVGEEEDTTE